jgi:hypothetical protein
VIEAGRACPVSTGNVEPAQVINVIFIGTWQTQTPALACGQNADAQARLRLVGGPTGPSRDAEGAVVVHRPAAIQYTV